ncbi:MAG: winged helix-turn-helix domain-containing protein, partial [Pyrinomonadaceae bacterium]
MRAGDSVVSISPKSFDLLSLLVLNSDELLSKEMIMAEVWANEYVEENNLTVRIASLRKTLGENRGDNAFIQTVQGHGYRFVAKVTPTAEMTELVGQEVISLAVLPLSNESNDPNLEYLSDGITESIINNLSRSKQIRVISRSKAFGYKNQEIDLQKIGSELNVQTVLIGRIYENSEDLV